MATPADRNLRSSQSFDAASSAAAAQPAASPTPPAQVKASEQAKEIFDKAAPSFEAQKLDEGALNQVKPEKQKFKNNVVKTTKAQVAGAIKNIFGKGNQTLLANNTLEDRTHLLNSKKEMIKGMREEASHLKAQFYSEEFLCSSRSAAHKWGELVHIDPADHKKAVLEANEHFEPFKNNLSKADKLLQEATNLEKDTIALSHEVKKLKMFSKSAAILLDSKKETLDEIETLTKAVGFFKKHRFELGVHTKEFAEILAQYNITNFYQLERKEIIPREERALLNDVEMLERGIPITSDEHKVIAEALTFFIEKESSYETLELFLGYPYRDYHQLAIVENILADLHKQLANIEASLKKIK